VYASFASPLIKIIIHQKKKGPANKCLQGLCVNKNLFAPSWSLYEIYILYLEGECLKEMDKCSGSRRW
jgi:hypothetical protein